MLDLNTETIINKFQRFLGRISAFQLKHAKNRLFGNKSSQKKAKSVGSIAKECERPYYH